MVGKDEAEDVKDGASIESDGREPTVGQKQAWPSKETVALCLQPLFCCWRCLARASRTIHTYRRVLLLEPSSFLPASSETYVIKRYVVCSTSRSSGWRWTFRTSINLLSAFLPLYHRHYRRQASLNLLNLVSYFNLTFDFFGSYDNGSLHLPEASIVEYFFHLGRLAVIL